MHEALNNLAVHLSWLASITDSPEEKHNLLRQAEEKARAANAAHAHSGDYNLACVLSLQGRVEEALPLLQADLERRPDMIEHALADKDLLPIWEAYPDERRRWEALAQHLA